MLSQREMSYADNFLPTTVCVNRRRGRDKPHFSEATFTSRKLKI